MQHSIETTTSDVSGADVCRWDRIGCEEDGWIWEAQCNGAWFTELDSPSGVGYVYCPYCGKKIEEVEMNQEILTAAKKELADCDQFILITKKGKSSMVTWGGGLSLSDMYKICDYINKEHIKPFYIEEVEG